MFLFYIHLYSWLRSKYSKPDHRYAFSGRCSLLSNSAFPEGQQAWHLTWSLANCLSISVVGNQAHWWKKTDGKDWLCLIWTIHPSERDPTASSAWMMSENLGSCISLNSLPIWIWLEFRYINQISLLWLPLSHINLHFIKSMKLEQRSDWAS